jgi:hypothetical protein
MRITVTKPVFCLRSFTLPLAVRTSICQIARVGGREVEVRGRKMEAGDQSQKSAPCLSIHEDRPTTIDQRFSLHAPRLQRRYQTANRPWSRRGKPNPRRSSQSGYDKRRGGFGKTGSGSTVNTGMSGSRTRQSAGNQHIELESPRSGERGYQNIELYSSEDKKPAHRAGIPAFWRTRLPEH